MSGLELIDDMIDRHVYNLKFADKEPDYKEMRPKFGWLPTEIIKHTFQVTTQFACSVHHYGEMRKHYRSRFPVLNIA